MTEQADREYERQFDRLIYGLCEAYAQKPTAARVKLYARALSDLSIDELRSACLRVVKESKFFPTVAELRSHVEPATDDAALLGWSALQQAAGQVGGYSSLVLEDGAAGAALVAVYGSWPEFCDQTDVAIAVRQKEFFAAYRQARRGQHGGILRLSGRCEASGNYADPSQLGSVWVGMVSASGDVKLMRDLEAEKLLADRPRRGMTLGSQSLIRKAES